VVEEVAEREAVDALRCGGAGEGVSLVAETEASGELAIIFVVSK